MRRRRGASLATGWTAAVLLALQAVCCVPAQAADEPTATGQAAPVALSADQQSRLAGLQSALEAARQLGDAPAEAKALSAIGDLYYGGDCARSLDAYRSALPVFRSVGDRAGEAVTLDNIGLAYACVGDREQALDYYSQALPIASGAGDPLLQAYVLFSLMQSRRSDAVALATFYGKQAVNLLQQVHGSLDGVDQDLQRSFLTSLYDYYRSLADLLINQRRLPEARQVLDLLKLQEYADFTRGEARDNLRPLALTRSEQKALQDFQRSMPGLGTDFSEVRDLLASPADGSGLAVSFEAGGARPSNLQNVYAGYAATPAGASMSALGLQLKQPVLCGR